jgi:hypothetical protein
MNYLSLPSQWSIYNGPSSHTDKDKENNDLFSIDILGHAVIINHPQTMNSYLKIDMSISYDHHRSSNIIRCVR